MDSRWHSAGVHGGGEVLQLLLSHAQPQGSVMSCRAHHMPQHCMQVGWYWPAVDEGQVQEVVTWCPPPPPPLPTRPLPKLHPAQHNQPCMTEGLECESSPQMEKHATTTSGEMKPATLSSTPSSPILSFHIPFNYRIPVLPFTHFIVGPPCLDVWPAPCFCHHCPHLLEGGV